MVILDNVGDTSVAYIKGAQKEKFKVFIYLNFNCTFSILLYTVKCTVHLTVRCLISCIIYCTLGFAANKTFREKIRKFTFVFRKIVREIPHFSRKWMKRKMRNWSKISHFAKMLELYFVYFDEFSQKNALILNSDVCIYFFAKIAHFFAKQMEVKFCEEKNIRIFCERTNCEKRGKILRNDFSFSWQTLLYAVQWNLF